MASKELNHPFSDLECQAFCGQMSLVLKAGISSLEGLHIMEEDCENEQEKGILQGLITHMEEHGSFSLALKDSGLFPEYLIHMAELGEETGTLDDVMEALKRHYAREDETKTIIRNALTYPMIMIGMMIAVVIVLLTRVMPVFNQVFIQLGTEMTGVSRVLMNLGTSIRSYSVALLIIFLILVLLLVFSTRTEKGRGALRSIGYHFGFSRKILEERASLRFASGLSLTLASGLNPERGMELVMALNEDEMFAKKLGRLNELTKDGADLAKSMQSSGIFTGMYARMALVGSKSGSLDQVMEQIAGIYQEDIDNRMSRMLSILEPTLVILLSLIVGVILLSVMLPLMSIMATL